MESKLDFQVSQSICSTVAYLHVNCAALNATYVNENPGAQI